MNRTERIPEEPVGPFPVPPTRFTDDAGRAIGIHVFGGGTVVSETDEFEALAEFYDEFDPIDRAQGIPPSEPDAIREWLSSIIVDDAIHVLAWHQDHVVGHATLVPDGNGAYELAIFVLQSYQGAGIGSRLIRYLLGEGAARGVRLVWLTVERWNDPAIALYRNTGFEVTTTENFEIEMGLRLDG